VHQDGSYTVLGKTGLSDGVVSTLNYTVQDADHTQSSSTFTLTEGVVKTGTTGADTLVGTAYNDLLIGGAGSDTMTGGTGSDTFKWSLADVPATGVAADVVKDFQLSTFTGAGAVATQGDVLNVKDLLTGHTATELATQLDFAEVGGNTVISVHAVGSTTVHQTITLEGVTMASLGGTAAHTEISDVAALQKLIDGHNISTT
jgi:Ca2+-binding RTX toxin-like protein